MKESDPKVYKALRDMYAVFGLPYYLEPILAVGVGSATKDWNSDGIANWLSDRLFEHPAHEDVRVDEGAMDLHTFEWADKITHLANAYSSDNQEIGSDDALYFVFCQWFARVVSLFTKWSQDKVESGIFNEGELSQLKKLENDLLQQIPPDKHNWDSIVGQIEKLASLWAEKTLP